MPINFDFSGKTYIVTGGNRGIGLAISEAIAEAGGNVGVIYHSAKDAPDIAAGIAKKYNVKCEAWKCDVGDPELVKKTFKEIDEKFGQVDGVVANAGISVVKDAIDLTKEDFNSVYSTNVFGPFACAQAAASLWIEKQYKGGSVVFVSSMSSQIVNKKIHQVWYNSSKAAASSIVKQLAVEWADKDIRVNALCPGYVETDQTSHMDPKLLSWQKDELVPLGRFSQPKEQAYMALFLLDNKFSSYCTGQEYFVDGGAQAW
ncbi:hypothetical protein BD324DRAFT_650595 [Kockovaella imperatae]|uniref:NADP-dependent mannitol dehydrogenase n=1 Tax=Kockovaella imperatae TaxID=4999 RepID=A0A1Y1UJA4_9TREE|nr:hypothetical protein BD324DRAFT_650595 [Kockovaella imperatae]ORX38062.1 hypothetical protein BD324DRAFT_650595 [Kockovaella imperatae]